MKDFLIEAAYTIVGIVGVLLLLLVLFGGGFWIMSQILEGFGYVLSNTVGALIGEMPGGRSSFGYQFYFAVFVFLLAGACFIGLGVAKTEKAAELWLKACGMLLILAVITVIKLVLAEYF